MFSVVAGLDKGVKNLSLLNMVLATALIGFVQDDNAIAVFKMLEQLPLTSIVSALTVVLIVTFFVTSSDSASLVIDSLAAGGIAPKLHAVLRRNILRASTATPCVIPPRMKNTIKIMNAPNRIGQRAQ